MSDGKDTKSKQFKAKIGRRENMRYDDFEDCYFCADGRKLPMFREKSVVTKDGYIKTTAYYLCSDCSGRQYKNKCFQFKKYPNKLLTVKRDLVDLCEQFRRNITTPEGHFIDTFKKYYGITPGQFRKNIGIK